MENLSNIRNFAIVAHIDHGKSTLADRLLEATGTIEKRLMTEQILDSNPIEKERGITIKLAPVRMKYGEYILNLIDTPGHVDFYYEVSRSLSACDGVLLVVDATQGVQAQTLSHMQHVRELNLKVIPIINKIDLPQAQVAETKKELVDLFGFKEEEIIEISAKEDINIDKVLEAIIKEIPSPHADSRDTKALVFSSNYDPHKGVVVLVRVFSGVVNSTTTLKLLATNCQFTPIEVGIFTPQMQTKETLCTGEVGYIATGLKSLSLAKVGDTIGRVSETITTLPGFREPKPMVFLSLFPIHNDDFPKVREGIEKLHLSDSSFTYKLHSTPALGKGFLCGFLGLLHADIVTERLKREFDAEVIATAPSVEYELITANDKKMLIHDPSDLPDPSLIKKIREPIMYTTIFSPRDYVGVVMNLCQEKRAEMINTEYLSNQAKFTYLLPLAEIILDFFDKLKSVTSGYASLDYELYEYRKVEAVKLDIFLNKQKVDAFSQIVHKDSLKYLAEKMVNKLKTLIPRHQFEIPIQAAVGAAVVARADVRAFRKDVTKKLYGGDQTRKDKLLEAQKKGKKRLKEFGRVQIPQEVFMMVFKTS